MTSCLPRLTAVILNALDDSGRGLHACVRGPSENRLIGELPPSVGRVASLTGLNLSGNQLTGVIPAELGGLIGLVELSLHFNQLTGRLAAKMGNLTDLAKLYPHSD